MANIIKPKEYLMRLKKKGISVPVIGPSDLLEIAELNMTTPFANTVHTLEFYCALKKAVSDFNGQAAINDHQPVDFDDLYTKYIEYIEALQTVVRESE